ncbi:hypothetical protein ES708_14966 [subsurface metagenome]
MVTKGKIHGPPPPSTPERAPWEDIAQLSEGIAQLIKRFDRLIALVEAAAPAVPVVPAVPGVPEVEVTVRTAWEAKEPEQIFSSAIRSAGTFYTDKMVNWTKGKRILFKVESSLNQAVQIQLIGNIVDSKELATDINGSLPCAANGNISVGPAWDDWHPYVGVKITAAVGEEPTAGLLTISAVVQE